MKLTKREKMLTGGTAALAVVVGGWFLLGYLGGSLSDLRAGNEQLQQDVEEKQLEVKKAAKAYELLADWNLRCLPSNRAAAASEYQNWLMELCEEANIQGRKVDIVTQRTEISGWTRIVFSIHGRGTLEQLAGLLDRFNEGDHLQQIVSLNLTPISEGSKTLDAVIAVEAVSLPGAVDAEGAARTDQLYVARQEPAADAGDPGNPPAESGDPPPKQAPDEHVALVVARNVFMPYSPPPPPPVEQKAPQPTEPPKPPGFDHLKFTVVTAIVEVNDQRQVWILTRTTGKLLKLVKGQSFEVGAEGDPARATIGTIGPREVEVISQHDGRQYMVALGDNLEPPPATPSPSDAAGSM